MGYTIQGLGLWASGSVMVRKRSRKLRTEGVEGDWRVEGAEGAERAVVGEVALRWVTRLRPPPAPEPGGVLQGSSLRSKLQPSP